MSLLVGLGCKDGVFGWKSLVGWCYGGFWIEDYRSQLIWVLNVFGVGG